MFQLLYFMGVSVRTPSYVSFHAKPLPQINFVPPVRLLVYPWSSEVFLCFFGKGNVNGASTLRQTNTILI